MTRGGGGGEGRGGRSLSFLGSTRLRVFILFVCTRTNLSPIAKQYVRPRSARAVRSLPSVERRARRFSLYVLAICWASQVVLGV